MISNWYDKTEYLQNDLKGLLTPNVCKYLQNLIASKLGVQKIGGITALDTREKKTYELVPEMEVSVLLTIFFIGSINSHIFSYMKSMILLIPHNWIITVVGNLYCRYL